MKRFKVYKSLVRSGDKEEWVYYWSMYDRNTSGNIIDAGKAWCNGRFPKEVQVLKTIPITYEEYKNARNDLH